MLSVWASEEEYLKSPFFKAIYPVPAQLLDAESDSFVVSISEPLPRNCAISVYYDENGDGKLNTNWLGIPREAVGSSNNVRGSMGPPDYQEAMIEVSGEGQHLHIELHKVLGF